MKGANLQEADLLHRHTGGLEKLVQKMTADIELHRHTGGLEIFDLI